MTTRIPFARAGYQRVRDEDAVLVNWEKLAAFCATVFMKLNMPQEDARIAADVLVQSDLRGVDSHGVAHMNLKSFYVASLLSGSVNPRPHTRVEHESPSTALLNGDNGLGLVVGHHGMNEAIRRAHNAGTGWVAVHNSHHYGMAAYFAMMALEHDMIGISMTNAGPQMVPTFGAKPMLGTNPIAVAIPAGHEPHFVLDMATTVTAGGKFEIASRLGLPIPTEWGADANGFPTTDPKVANSARFYYPLGGTREGSSHKGYGLGVVVDVLTGILSGAGASFLLPRGYSGHFFGAMRVDGFCTVGDFKSRMDEMLRGLKQTPPAPGHDRVYVAGEIEYEMKQERMAKGIPLHKVVMQQLLDISKELGVPCDIEARR
ncbi:MAG: Ldh family oxidoreductase [Dehalococcoidia bacterium]|nr:Ldh family oxidoreductase [Dehalococcoidia bacterium]